MPEGTSAGVTPPNFARPVLFYVGGFPPVGGIQTFARDLLLALGDQLGPRELIAWGRPAARNPLLRQIRDSGVRLTHSWWRWGCRWRWPDRVLLRRGLAAVGRAKLVLFGQSFGPKFHYRLRTAAAGRYVPFVLITPYRPSEMWGDRPDPALLRAFDAIIVQTDSFAADLRRQGFAGRIEILPYVPPHVLPVSPMPITPGGSTRIGYLGRMEVPKNLPYLLETFDILRRHVSADKVWELHLFGDGSQRSRLERRVAELRLRPHVHFHGALSHDKVALAIDTCHLFANSSTTEGQCLVALEVLSRGRPLVATPVGALPSLITGPAFGELVPLSDPPAFAAALLRVARAVASRRITPQNLRAGYDAAFNRDEVVRRYVQLFHEFCDDNGKSSGPHDVPHGLS